MKKKISGIVAIVVLAMIVGYNVYTSQKNTNLSDLALANVEALANNGEGDAAITCNQSKNKSPGACWIKYGECYISGLIRFDDCKFTGYMVHKCVTPCD